jgi:hypothetical protein
MMHDYRPKSVNQHHKIVIKCWFGGRKKEFICMCVCCRALRNTTARNRQLARQCDKLPPGVNTTMTLYISDYFVTNISSNMCNSSFSPSICSGIACTAVDYGHSSHHLLISVRDYGMLNISSTNPVIIRLTSTLYMVILSHSYWTILPTTSCTVLTLWHRNLTFKF